MFYYRIITYIMGSVMGIDRIDSVQFHSSFNYALSTHKGNCDGAEFMIYSPDHSIMLESMMFEFFYTRWRRCYEACQ